MERLKIEITSKNMDATKLLSDFLATARDAGGGTVDWTLAFVSPSDDEVRVYENGTATWSS